MLVKIDVVFFYYFLLHLFSIDLVKVLIWAQWIEFIDAQCEENNVDKHNCTLDKSMVFKKSCVFLKNITYIN